MITLVYFYSDSCTACTEVSSIIEQIKKDFNNIALIVTPIKVVTENMSIIYEWNIEAIPTVVVIDIKPNQIAEERARFVGTEEVTMENLIYSIEAILKENE